MGGEGGSRGFAAHSRASRLVFTAHEAAAGRFGGVVNGGIEATCRVKSLPALARRRSSAERLGDGTMSDSPVALAIMLPFALLRIKPAEKYPWLGVN